MRVSAYVAAALLCANCAAETRVLLECEPEAKGGVPCFADPEPETCNPVKGCPSTDLCKAGECVLSRVWC